MIFKISGGQLPGCPPLADLGNGNCSDGEL